MRQVDLGQIARAILDSNVYMTLATADPTVRIFSNGSVARGAGEWTPEDEPPAFHRLYRATASEHWILDPRDHPIHGRTGDHRTPVSP